MTRMSATQLSKAICLSALIATSPIALSDAMAQTQPSPSTTAPAEKIAPPDTPVQAAPAPSPSTTPSPPSATAATPATVPASDVAIGSVVFGSDGMRLGKIDAVKANSGSVNEIHVHVGGLFGFGGKTVSVPGDKITKTGSTIQIGLTSDQVDKLPAIGKTNG